MKKSLLTYIIMSAQLLALVILLLATNHVVRYHIVNNQQTGIEHHGCLCHEEQAAQTEHHSGNCCDEEKCPCFQCDIPHNLTYKEEQRHQIVSVPEMHKNFIYFPFADKSYVSFVQQQIPRNINAPPSLRAPPYC